MLKLCVLVISFLCDGIPLMKVTRKRYGTELSSCLLLSCAQLILFIVVFVLFLFFFVFVAFRDVNWVGWAVGLNRLSAAARIRGYVVGAGVCCRGRMTSGWLFYGIV